MVSSRCGAGGGGVGFVGVDGGCEVSLAFLLLNGEEDHILLCIGDADVHTGLDLTCKFDTSPNIKKLQGRCFCSGLECAAFSIVEGNLSLTSLHKDKFLLFYTRQACSRQLPVFPVNSIPEVDLVWVPPFC
ncbi:hypothetical protein AV530_018653 [Patagioenas fasciata monilis]|uniref:Uncharacterized protein n=1 Tax=Patagioenas fasciata monilis TaxID=372326 RepID=A0A1V4J8R8_PATFA|nr:hypothetical protein AV530_018653 [Patagioenas fasciata monilis]